MNDAQSSSTGGSTSLAKPAREPAQTLTATATATATTTTTATASMCNTNSASVASLSSNDSGESYVVEREEMVVLSNEARDLEEALGRLSVLFQTGIQFNELTKVEAFDRLGEVLKILRHMMTEYPALQSDELITTGGKLIKKVKNIDWGSPQGRPDERQDTQDIQDVQDILELIASTLSTRVTEFLVGDLENDNLPSSSPSTKKLKSGSHLATGYYDSDSLRICDTKILTDHQIDAVLLQNDLGVDLALARVKAWSKYAKDVLNYIEKKTTMEFEFARNLSKLAQTTRPILNEESFLPFKSIYCISLDQDLEMCGSMQATCSQIQGYKFSEPLTMKRAEHEKTRKCLKDRWEKERKRIQEAVASLLKAKAIYLQRIQEYDRSRETLRAAECEAGSEKYEKKKRLEEEALQKLAESELLYKQSVTEANERQHHLLAAKADILKQVRELNVQCDLTMKMATVSYFQLQHTMNAPVPGQYQTLCESSRLYEPGSQFMEYVKSLPQPPFTDPNQVVTQDPFTFEPHRGTSGHAPLATTDETELSQLPQVSQERPPDQPSSKSGSIPNDVEPCGPGLPKVTAMGPDDIASLIEWTSAISGGASHPDGSETDSADSGKSSPTTNNHHSPMPNNTFHQDHRQALIYFDNDRDSTSPVGKDTKGANKNLSDSFSALGQRRGPLSPSAPSQRQIMSKAAVTHRFRKLKTPSKCRECDSYVYFQGYDCQDCGLSSHKKCLETLALQCGHKRLPRKMTTFGVDLSQHLSDTNATVPPLVCKCVHEIETRGLKFKGLYRVSSAKPKVERLCQTFENGAELVDLTDIHVPVIANVLKLYLRQLPEPLITSPLYRDFIRIAELCPAPGGDSTISEETAVAELRELCRRLPKTHYHTLGFLMHHIRRVAEEHESNNMPVSNLAIVFGPTLLWSNKGNTSLTTVMETPHQARAIELISIHATDIFGPPETVIPKDYSRYTTNPPHHSHPHPHPHLHQHQNQHPHHRTPIKEEGRSRSTCGGKAYKSGRRRRQILSAREANHGSRHRVELFRDESSHSGPTVGSQESGEDIFGVTGSDENEDNAEPIPPFLLPDALPGKSKKSPAKFRPSSSPPKIIKQSLKNFSGLEGVTPGMLSTQDSLEVVQKLGLKPDGSITRRSVQQEMSVPVTTSSASDDRGGKSLKKHSLDEEFFVTSDQMKMAAQFHLNPSDPSSASSAGSTTAVTSPRTNQPHYRSQQLVPVGRSSLRIGSPSGGSSSNIQSSSTSVRSCSLSDEAQSVAISHRHRLRGLTSSASHAGMASTLTTSGGGASSNIAHSSSLSHSLPTEVMTIDENRFKIRVPGLQPQKMAVRSHLAAAKQSSLDKDDR